jgi:hypothetical protein
VDYEYRILTDVQRREGYRQRLQVLEGDIFQKSMELAELEAIVKVTGNPVDVRNAMKEIGNLKSSIEYTKIRIRVTKEAMAELPEPPAVKEQSEQ